MSGEDLIKEHLENKCKYCNMQDDCDGIHITIDRKTKCDRDGR